MAFNYDEYLRVDKTPTLWCWGCGDGVILKCIIRAMDNLGWNMDDVCLVSGIGCSGRMSSYVNCNTVHTTHGRALAYATVLKWLIQVSMWWWFQAMGIALLLEAITLFMPVGAILI